MAGIFTQRNINQLRTLGGLPGAAPQFVEYLVVAGGGSGGGNGGGGGAGGLLTGIVTVATGTSYTVTVGAGGTGGVYPTQANGNNSVFGSINATAGGKGGGDSASYPAGSGGSGGGSGYYASIGQGTSGQGNAGGAQNGINSGGGGGGAGTVGLNGATTSIGGNGGAGIASAITGTVATYAGGGGGWANTPGTGGVGGVGGGGSTGAYQGVAGSGGGNTGGGGAGSAGGSGTSGSGGSGIVVVRYPGNIQFYTGGAVTYANGYIVHIFYATGTLAPTTPAVIATDYQISRSLRFNSADSANLSRTFGTPTNANVWTFSCWIKRSALGAYSTILGRSGNTYPVYQFLTSTNTFGVYDSGSANTTAVFRDPSAWYHLVIQRTDSTTVTVYFNGVSQLTTTGQTNAFNLSGSTYTIGKSNAGEYFDGYMTEINFVDGQALTPSSFGATNTNTGVWGPKAYTGTYGTNGFYLNFSDNSNTTAATLGKDYSGNGNNWTPNNFSVTAGAGNDSLVDVPTNYGTDYGIGGSVRGNYATLNPIGNPSVPTYSITNGNLDYAATGGSGNATKQAAIATIGVTTGKWYYEGTVTSNNPGLGFSSELFYNSQRGTIRITYFSGSLANSAGITATGSPATFTNGDVIAVAYDADAGTATVYKNNVSQGTFSGIAIGTALFPYVEPNTADSGSGVSFNFGQRPFAYTPPGGFKALNTQNLPAPTIGSSPTTLADKFFNILTYTGNGSSQSVTGVGFQPDFVWVKERSSTSGNVLFDAIRGVTKYLESNEPAAEGTDASTLTAFNSDGFSVGSSGAMNQSSQTYVGWNWKANGAGSFNTAGSITSTVSANPTSGFSIVTYTGTGANATVGHGLGVAPSMLIIKRRSSSASDSSWIVGHVGITMGSGRLILNGTDANTAGGASVLWNSTAASSTVFSIGNYTAVNDSGATFVAYCFAPIAGYSAFGSYTGNGSADGPFVFTGFRPAFVMVKRSSSSGTNWQILDTKRSTYNVMADYLYASAANAEGYDTGVGIDSLSNGFKIRGTDANTNTSTATYIYMAFAESPFKYSLAR
jgi:hypothetical protein